MILYGSRARGEATSQSDWDLKVIVSDEALERFSSPMSGWRLQEGSGVYADVSCIRLSDFQADLSVANSASNHIVADGIVIDVR
ncbi:nucleotidyltransferase domain-containing protein (plasmid) [Agrobacterium pusense]|nr:nucleotidyltransferase domain-containing protein [Agrobacterium pusense]